MNWVLLCVCLFVLSCQNQPLASDKKPASIKSYVSLDLEYPEYQQALNKFDAFLGTTLINRGEAHVMVITLGFTEKDLHFEQGVIKNQKSCPKKLQPLL